MFDERGLAGAVLRLDYVNGLGVPADHVSLNIPGRDVTVVNAFVKRECSANRTSDRSYNYYDSECPYGYEFVPAQVRKNGEGSYDVMLNGTLAPGESTGVLVYYRAFGYASDDLRGKKFDFETIRNDFDVESTRVAIDVDEDLRLKEGGSGGNYNQMRSAIIAGGSASSSGAGLQAALSSSYNYVGYASGYVREKSTLLAGETYTVSGTYSREWLRLYLPEIIAFLALLGAVAWFVKRRADGIVAVKDAEKGGAVVKGEAKGKNGNLADSAALSFMAAVGFALFASLATVCKLVSGVSIEPGLLAGAALLSWGATASWVYIQGSARGAGLISAAMFIGFSVIITPFMMLMAWWVASSFLYHPYYAY